MSGAGGWGKFLWDEVNETWNVIQTMYMINFAYIDLDDYVPIYT